ncbi:MAG TPA: DnaJ C-terminal domain-containing protein [Candidatus Methylacidiphilales bacterium]
MPVEFKDYYSSLGVPRDASPEDIKKAFRKLARQYHPDVAKDKKAAEEKFKEINEAHEVLGDPQKRQRYDELGANWKERAYHPPRGRQYRTPRGSGEDQDYEFHFGGTGFSDFFEQFFGRADGRDFSFGGNGFDGQEFHHRPRGPVRGSDIEGDILVTLNEVVNGAVRTISLQSTNPRTGETEEQQLKVRIPAGVHEGQRIRVAGKGTEGTGGGSAGDLYMRVRLAAHPDFQVSGSDLYYDLDLAPWEGVLGTTATVSTLKGRVNVRIPAGTNNGRKLRVRGHGLPQSPGGENGDLYVVVNVRLPRQINDDERELWEKLGRISHFNPRKTT